MDAFQSRYAQTLCDNLEKTIAEQSEHLISAVAPDYASYRQGVGFIRGLQHALKEARELEQVLSRPDTKPELVQLKRQSYEA